MKHEKFYSVKFDVLGKPERKIGIPRICRDIIMIMNIFALFLSLLQWCYIHCLYFALRTYHLITYVGQKRWYIVISPSSLVLVVRNFP